MVWYDCVKGNLPKSEIIVATTKKKWFRQKGEKRFNDTNLKIRLRSSRKSIISSWNLKYESI